MSEENESKKYKIEVKTKSLPEIDLYARAEAEIETCKAFCSQCEILYNERGIIDKILGNRYYLDSKKKAIEYVGKAFRDMKNERVQTEVRYNDYLINLFIQFSKPLLDIVEWSALKDHKKIKTIAQDIISDVSKELGIKTSLNEQGIYTSLYNLAEEDDKKLIDISINKGLNYLFGRFVRKLDSLEKREIIDFIESKKEGYKRLSDLHGEESILSFIQICSKKVCPDESCIDNRKKLDEIREIKEMNKILKTNRDAINSLIFYGADVVKALVKNITEDELNDLKDMGKLFKKQLEEKIKIEKELGRF